MWSMLPPVKTLTVCETALRAICAALWVGHFPAGVADKERGQAALSFAKRYELMSGEALSNIKLVEVDYSDPDSFAVPSRGRLVVVDGDTYVGGKAADVS